MIVSVLLKMIAGVTPIVACTSAVLVMIVPGGVGTASAAPLTSSAVRKANAFCCTLIL
jgi:hypothetical protein